MYLCLLFATLVEKLKEIFEEYGEVTEYNIMKDPVNKKSRCVCVSSSCILQSPLPNLFLAKLH